MTAKCCKLQTMLFRCKCVYKCMDLQYSCISFNYNFLYFLFVMKKNGCKQNQQLKGNIVQYVLPKHISIVYDHVVSLSTKVLVHQLSLPDNCEMIFCVVQMSSQIPNVPQQVYFIGSNMTNASQLICCRCVCFIILKM